MLSQTIRTRQPLRAQFLVTVLYPHSFRSASQAAAPCGRQLPLNNGAASRKSCSPQLHAFPTVQWPSCGRIVLSEDSSALVQLPLADVLEKTQPYTKLASIGDFVSSTKLMEQIEIPLTTALVDQRPGGCQKAFDGGNVRAMEFPVTFIARPPVLATALLLAACASAIMRGMRS